jgi:hypothetical protein
VSLYLTTRKVFLGDKKRQVVVLTAETVTVVGISASHIAHRKSDIRAAIARFVFGARYLFRGEVGADYRVSVSAKSDCLSSYATRNIQDAFGFGPFAFDDAGKLFTLAADASVPVLEDQVVEWGEFIVKVGHV